MRTFFRDIRAHWPSALLFLAYWVAAWGVDAAVAIHRRREVGSYHTSAVVVLTCLLTPLFGAALAAWWTAQKGHTRSLGRDSVLAGLIAGALVCEVNLAVIFCEDAGISTLFTGGSKTQFDLFVGAILFGAAGAVLGLFAVLTVLGLMRTVALFRHRPGT